MAVNAFVLGLTTIRYVAFHPCTVSSIHVCDFFPVYERCSRRGGTPPDRGVGLDGRVVIVRHYRPALSLSLSSSVRRCLGKTGAKGTWTCASTGWKKKRRKERGKKGVEAVCFADVGGGGGGGGGSCFFFWRGGGVGICIHCVGWTPARHNKNLGFEEERYSCDSRASRRNRERSTFFLSR